MRERDNSGRALTKKRSRRMRACSFDTTNLNVVGSSLVAFNAATAILCPQTRQCYSRFPCRLKKAVHDTDVLDAGGYEPLVRVVCRNCGQKNLLQRTFDHFVPVETLGAGGMGTVYKARDTQLERFVALKLLHKDLSSGADHDTQLQQEARIAASVNHPNVVQIFSLGTDHGRFYVVMELIDHGSLDDLMESQGRVPEHQVLDIGIQIARGLRAAHRKGLIHRDVKPANILFVD